jgi:hypothetical protein
VLVPKALGPHEGGFSSISDRSAWDVFIVDAKGFDSLLSMKVLDAQASHTTTIQTDLQNKIVTQVASVPKERKSAQRLLVSIIQRWMD